MEIRINNEKIDFILENEKTVGEILGEIESTCEKSAMTITKIRIDGEEIPASELDFIFEKSPSDIKIIELYTISGKEILFLIKQSGDKMLSYVSQLEQIPVELQTGKNLEVMETINTFSTELQEIYRMLPLLPLTGINIEKTDFEGENIIHCPEKLAPLLHSLLDAMKANDTVQVGDISEYELAPRIKLLGEILLAI
ncbi:MAG TPA: hypothetical protein VJ861_13200 [Treponemataceae bacterium]|nr:hypothetical protein [Treponemataceae bacterium]